MIKLIFILFSIIVIILFMNKNELFSNLNKYFTKQELKEFEKYKSYSNTYKTNYGEITYTDSKIIEEIPHPSLNGYFINNLVVYPQYRGKKKGEKLIKWVIDKAKKEGKLHLISQVKFENDPAVKLHDKLGFNRYEIGLNKTQEKVIIYIYFI